MSRLQKPGHKSTSNSKVNKAVPPTVRLLHVYQEGTTHRRAFILDSDKKSSLYKINVDGYRLFTKKPHVTISTADSSMVVGTVTFHSFSSKIDLTIHNQSTTLFKAGIFRSTHAFQSSAGVLTWKSDGMFSSGNMLCVDEKEQLVAKFKVSEWSLKKRGTFELLWEVGNSFMDEIVVSGIAMVEWRKRQQGSAASTSGGCSVGGGF